MEENLWSGQGFTHNFDMTLAVDPETWFKVITQLLPKGTGT